MNDWRVTVPSAFDTILERVIRRVLLGIRSILFARGIRWLSHFRFTIDLWASLIFARDLILECMRAGVSKGDRCRVVLVLNGVRPRVVLNVEMSSTLLLLLFA